jgi:hypothetical protein
MFGKPFRVGLLTNNCGQAIWKWSDMAKSVESNPYLLACPVFAGMIVKVQCGQFVAEWQFFSTR